MFQVTVHPNTSLSWGQNYIPSSITYAYEWFCVYTMLNPLKMMVVVDEHLHDSTYKNSRKTINNANRLVILDGEKIS